jgi:pimeloyl-ACP methyl ester carboxylesterase
MKNTKSNQFDYTQVPTQFIELNEVRYAYRTYWKADGTPIIFLNHWGAVLDNFDPYIVDAIAKFYRIITVDYRGIGTSSGNAPLTIGEMADDMIAFTRALRFTQVDLFGFSLWGMVAQDMVLKAPELFKKMILTGTWPAWGRWINQVGAVSWPLIIKGLLTFQDPKLYLFFTASEESRLAGKAFLARLKERKANRDKEPTPRAFLRQLKAIHAWGNQSPQDLWKITIPVLVANGDNDIMVPTENTIDTAKRIKNSELIVYKDAGHGGIFQYHEDFVSQALTFLSK